MKYLNTNGYLTGQLLVAMPQIPDNRFNRSVVYMCVHNDQGAMGLIINRLVGSISFREILQQLGIKDEGSRDTPIYFGGPVETSRGFVLHSLDYQETGTILVNKHFGLTASLDLLKLIATNQGPKNYLLALGYTGWGAHQLEKELQENSWLATPGDEGIIFSPINLDEKWALSLGKLGISVSQLSSDYGHA